MIEVQPLRDGFRREPVTISYPESAKFSEVYGFAGGTGRIYLEGQLFRPDAPSRTLLLFMHPSSSMTLLTMPRALAEAGFHVLCCGSRYLRNDSALIMEKVAFDLGAYVQWARGTMGYDKVVLVGWSGGGSLSLFYQSLVERPRELVSADQRFDFRSAGLAGADALISIAAHLSRAETVTEWLDPSVMDEQNPELRDPELDIYARNFRFGPPYPADFMARYRSAQRARSRRITDWCEAELEDLARRQDGTHERAFVVHRTMADPRWHDGTIDPNERALDWCYQGDPRAVNTGPTGLARFTTLRSWLSQWSYDRSNAKTADTAPHITIPALVIENAADDAVPATHPRRIFDLIGSTDKRYERIAGATHYYKGQPELQAQAVSTCREWLDGLGLVDVRGVSAATG